MRIGIIIHVINAQYNANNAHYKQTQQSSSASNATPTTPYTTQPADNKPSNAQYPRT